MSKIKSCSDLFEEAPAHGSDLYRIAALDNRKSSEGKHCMKQLPFLGSYEDSVLKSVIQREFKGGPF